MLENQTALHLVRNHELWVQKEQGTEWLPLFLVAKEELVVEHLTLLNRLLDVIDIVIN